MTRPIAALDVPLARLETEMQALVRRQRAQAAVDASVTRLRWLLAHQDEAPKRPAPVGELAEYRHLLYDADADATTPAFPYPSTLEAS